MKRGWTTFSLLTSVALALSGGSIVALAQRATVSSPRSNELTLAGLRPGRDTLATAFKRYNAKYLSKDSDASSMKEWLDSCTGRALRVEADSHSVIQEITISSLGPQEGKCDVRRFELMNMKDWNTGRGLRLGDSRNRVTDLYGEPDSSSPSVKGDSELEFLYYSFDWAAPDTPQVMEIYCTRDTGRVLEITLAFPSL